MTIKAGNISKGQYIDFKNQPHQVIKTEFHSPGKGSAFNKVKMKNLKTGSNVEFTYKSNEQVEILDVNSRQMQFLYHDSSDAYFMDPQSFEQIEIPLPNLDGKELLMIPETKVYILFFEDKALGISLPPKVKLKVTEAEDAVAGDTVNAPKKPVTLETGLVVQAPLFIKKGETLLIDTETGSYVSRAN